MRLKRTDYSDRAIVIPCDWCEKTLITQDMPVYVDEDENRRYCRTCAEQLAPGSTSTVDSGCTNRTNHVTGNICNTCGGVA